MFYALGCATLTSYSLIHQLAQALDSLGRHVSDNKQKKNNKFTPNSLSDFTSTQKNAFVGGVVVYCDNVPGANPQDRYILLAREAHGKRKEEWGIFDGKSNANESPLQTAAREFGEEAALRFMDNPKFYKGNAQYPSNTSQLDTNAVAHFIKQKLQKVVVQYAYNKNHKNRFVYYFIKVSYKEMIDLLKPFNSMYNLNTEEKEKDYLANC